MADQAIDNSGYDGIGAAQPLRADYRQLGVSGLNQFQGWIHEGHDRKLMGRAAQRIYGEMADLDPSCALLVFMIQNLGRTVSWFVREHSSDPADIENAQLVETCMQDMTEGWDDTISANLSMCPQGFSLHEICYKKRSGRSEKPWLNSKFDDGKIGWAGLPMRSQDSVEKWDLDEANNILGVWQQAPPRHEKVYIPAEKFLLFRTSNFKGNPEGLSMFRRAVRPWRKKVALEQIEGISIERDLCGLPVITAPPEVLADNASPKNQRLKESLRKIATEVKTDEQMGVLFPSAFDANNNQQFTFSLMSSGGAKSIDVGKVIERYDTQIFRSSLADFLTLGQGTNSSGSWSMHSDKSAMFLMSLKTYLAQIRDVYNRFAIPRLMELNGIVAKGYPQIDHTPLEQVDMAQMATAVNQLASSGMAIFPNPDVERRLFEILGLPAPVDDDSAPNTPEMGLSTQNQGDQAQEVFPGQHVDDDGEVQGDPIDVAEPPRRSSAKPAPDGDERFAQQFRPRPKAMNRFG